MRKSRFWIYAFFLQQKYVKIDFCCLQKTSALTGCGSFPKKKTPEKQDSGGYIWNKKKQKTGWGQCL